MEQLQQGIAAVVVQERQSGNRLKRSYDHALLDTPDEGKTSPVTWHRTSPAPNTSIISLCFRLLGIPSLWTVEQVLKLLEENLEFVRSDDDHLRLYPAADSTELLVGLLSIKRPRDYIDTFAPLDHDHPKRTVCVEKNITVDRFFYGLTPLNTPNGTPVAE